MRPMLLMSWGCSGDGFIVTRAEFEAHVDADGDGYVSDLWGSGSDCDDGDPAIHPGATEVLFNGVDDDCDPTTPDADEDGDGFDAIEAGGEDCDDSDPKVHPDATESDDNAIDDDCDGDRALGSWRGAAAVLEGTIVLGNDTEMAQVTDTEVLDFGQGGATSMAVHPAGLLTGEEQWVRLWTAEGEAIAGTTQLGQEVTSVAAAGPTVLVGLDGLSELHAYEVDGALFVDGGSIDLAGATGAFGAGIAATPTVVVVSDPAKADVARFDSGTGAWLGIQGGGGGSLALQDNGNLAVASGSSLVVCNPTCNAELSLSAQAVVWLARGEEEPGLAILTGTTVELMADQEFVGTIELSPAGLAAGDVDGDGFDELVAFGEESWVYDGAGLW